MSFSFPSLYLSQFRRYPPHTISVQCVLPFLQKCELLKVPSFVLPWLASRSSRGRYSRAARFMGRGTALVFVILDKQKEAMHRAWVEGARGIVNSGLIPSLVWKLQSEEEHIQEIILDTLAPCLQEDATEALDSQAVPRLKEKLQNENPQIRSKAARALIAISIPLEGKNQVWQNDVIPILVELLSDSEEEVQANAAGALMHAAVTTEGKYAALDADAINPLLELLCSTPTTKVCLNATKALTMLAEAPEGRKLLQPHIPTFRLLQMHKSEAIQRAAKVAIKVIEWKP
ncbi:Rsph14 [Phodopus roborovskii]|uniref:Rsph14 protein n=1 Tax=Phodopus roborovskii TaxID=109678 RepID=A0AAU9ZAP7_PHORO|nr:Rsph14 [Phodopus roborovskii]